MKHKIVSILVLLGLILGLMTIPAQAATPDQIEQSIVKGLAWLASTQNSTSGCWGDSERVAHTGFAVVKLEERAFDLGYQSPFDSAYSYSTNVTRGLRFILRRAGSYGPGTGICFEIGGHETYHTGIAMMAIAASRAPDRVVDVGNPVVDGMTYKQVLQANVDFFAWSQNPDGAWRYHAADEPSDNSKTGFAVLGLRYAEAALYGFQCTIPATVKTRLSPWLDYIQNDVDGDTDDGGSHYVMPGDGWVNILKTGNLLAETAFVGDTTGTQRVKDAIAYLVRHWNDANYQPGWRGPGGDQPAFYQAMYCVMKGALAFKIDTIDSIDWYADFANVLIAQQNADGSWPPSLLSTVHGWSDMILSTEWALLTLEKVAPPPPVNVVVDVPDCACDITGYQVKITYTVERFTVNGALKVSKDGVPVDTVNLVNFTGTATYTRNVASDTPGTHTWKGVLDVTPVGGGTPGHAEGSDSVKVCESPKVAGIPDQIAPFHTFDLDNYLTYAGGLPVIWSASVPPAGWTVAIDGNNVVTVTAPPGAGTPATITFTASVTCCPGVICKGSDDAVFTPNRPPDTSKAYADPGCLWPPDHKFVNVSIKGVTDPDGDPVTITITKITSDEPTASDEGSGGAKHAPDATGVGTGTASVRAERSGDGDGRVYVISFTASDGRGGVSQGTVMVKVPHDQSSKDCTAIDSGQKYDATQIN